MKLNKITLFIIIIFILTYLLSCEIYEAPRHISQRKEYITLWNHNKLNVLYTYSRWIYIMQVHSLNNIGGGGELYELIFDYNKNKYKWTSDHMPISLQIDGNDLYVICFDHYKDYKHDNNHPCETNNIISLYCRGYCHRFWFYKYVINSWKEVNRTQIPKNIAIQNLSKWYWYPGYMQEMDSLPKSDEINFYKINWLSIKNDFCITTNLWYFLETGSYIKSDYCVVPDSFIKKYYEKWIYK